MKLRYILSFLFVLLISFNVKSQTIKKFSDDPAAFFEELTNFFQDVDNPNDKKTVKEFLNSFTDEWNANKFSDDQKKEMIATCNLMLKKKMKPIPHFKNYLSTIISFNNTKQSAESFKAWEASLGKLINRSTSTLFIEYLDISNNLFTSNILYKSSTTVWKSNNNNYTFEYDSIPRIVFPSLNLSCYANNDSSNIYNTKGIYYPTLGKFIGQGGKVLWTRAGFSADSVYAEINYYRITVQYSKYTIDSVRFFNKHYFDRPLLGSLEEKILANVTPEKATYPKFESYDKRFQIKNIFPNIDYDGGFAMNGSKFIGTGDKTQDANLTFYREGNKFIKTGSKTYIIRKDKISSARASVTIYWEKDSIYHPGLSIQYILAKNELSGTRDKEGVGLSPFSDTYHKLDMYVEAFYWKMDQPILELKMAKSVGNESEAKFESVNYYTPELYYKLMGIDETHPLSDLRKYARMKKDTVSVYVPDYARYLKIDESQVEAMMINLESYGFISYDIDNNKVYLKDKINSFLFSKAGKVDYDVIQFNSVTKGQSNATINLLNFDLKLNGVHTVFLSDSQNVYLYPKDEHLVVKKNRDFDFDGRIHAGLFDFYGKLFSFSYEKFKLDMPVIDSMCFSVRSFKLNDKGKYDIVRVKSAIEGIKGNMQIDAPNNKSGLKSLHQYPLFSSLNDSYVYYNKKSIFNGVYNKSSFYFHIDPFQIDSLARISTEGLVFGGTFKSASIFPDIYDTLRVQPDYSLGFVRLSPGNGYPAYGGKGTFDSIVDLSNKGLRGNGTLKYITSISKSNEFVFFPDSMVADVKSYVINEQKSDPEYPPVTAENVKEKWLPYHDLMIVSKKLTPLAMYNNETKLHGSLYLSPTALTGRGTLQFKDAEIDAQLFKFKNRVFDSDTTDFRLKSYDLSELSFETKNYKAHVDFDLRKGEFKSNGGNSKVEFPVNQYICFMDEFDWFMDKEEIDLANNSNKTAGLEDKTLKEISDLDLSGSEFVSVRPDQDSLRFYSPRAKYNLRNNIIFCNDVKIIKVADAAIFPDKGEVTILKKAEMKPLLNAQILANTTTKYHTIRDALVNITGKKKYSASGTYDYIDVNNKKHPIYFAKIGVDSTIQTYGNGAIPDTAKFKLSPAFDYTGNVNLLASNEFLNFKGAFRISHTCDTNYRPWVKFRSDINPTDIYIPIGDTIKDIYNSKLDAGIFLSNDSIYTALLSKKFRSSDLDIITARGFLFYDSISGEYRISNKAKLKQLSLPGKYLSLTTASCITLGDGKIDLATNLGRVTFNAYGNVKHYIIPDSAKFDLALYIDFFFSDDAFKLMNQDLEKYNKLRAFDLTNNIFAKSLAEQLGTKASDKLISEIAMNGAFKKIPSDLEHTFIFGGIQMKWNPSTKSFISDGPIGIISMGKNQINKYVNGYIEVIKKKSVEEINIYLEFDTGDWYFFNYKQNVMQAISSNTEFNKTIKETKADNRALKSEKDLPPYQYTVSTEMKKKAFLEKFK